VKRPSRDFRALLQSFLDQKFETIVRHNVELDGARKQHKFANLVSLSHGKKLVVDPCQEPASIGSYSGPPDLRERKYDGLIQRIIYDDEENWDGSSLDLLQWAQQ
jgi:hypothetical protein